MNGKELIKEFEGLRLTAYYCPANKLTIGYGDTTNVKEGMKITKKDAETRLDKSYKKFETEVKKLVKVDINENQLGALVSFAYNLGTTNLAKSTLLRKLNEKDYKGAAEEFKRWKFANGVVMQGLVRRRQAEAELFLKPIEE